MTHDQLTIFRQILVESMEQILGRGKKNALAISESYQACPDLNDRASLESDRHMLIVLGEHERGVIRQIKAALSRFDDGSYGVCRECGEDIPLQRLQILPSSTLCVLCQEDLERRAFRNVWSVHEAKSDAG